MIRRAHLLSVLMLASLGGAAVAAVAPNTPTPMPKVRAQMKEAVDKTSTDLFNTAGEADPENGPDQKLPDAAGWTRIKADADALKGVADWLQQPANGKTTEAAAQAMSAAIASGSSCWPSPCTICLKVWRSASALQKQT